MFIVKQLQYHRYELTAHFVTIIVWFCIWIDIIKVISVFITDWNACFGLSQNQLPGKK